MNCTNESVLSAVKRLFLSVTTNKMLFKTILLPLFPLSPDVQERITLATVKDSICGRYPPSLSYQKFFLRMLMDWVEECKSETSEELLVAYTDVLSRSEEQSASCYVTYILNKEMRITLQENRNFVVDGTTGLKTWEASKYLSEWCMEHPSLFKNKKVLELGSGTGLLGMTVLKTCKPSAFVFTDKSESVLYQLSKNLSINGYSSHSCFVDCCEDSHMKSNSERKSLNKGEESAFVEISKLDWNSNSRVSSQKFSPDIVLGADIVFDPACIDGLVATLHSFLENGARCAYIASTIRNEETQKMFLKKLEERGLFREHITAPTISIFFYSTDSLFALYRIFCKS